MISSWSIYERLAFLHNLLGVYYQVDDLFPFPQEEDIWYENLKTDRQQKNTEMKDIKDTSNT